jgi:hypothetical protein
MESSSFYRLWCEHGWNANEQQSARSSTILLPGHRWVCGYESRHVPSYAKRVCRSRHVLRIQRAIWVLSPHGVRHDYPLLKPLHGPHPQEFSPADPRPYRELHIGSLVASSSRIQEHRAGGRRYSVPNFATETIRGVQRGGNFSQSLLV